MSGLRLTTTTVVNIKKVRHGNRTATGHSESPTVCLKWKSKLCRKWVRMCGKQGNKPHLFIYYFINVLFIYFNYLLFVYLHIYLFIHGSLYSAVKSSDYTECIFNVLELMCVMQSRNNYHYTLLLKNINHYSRLQPVFYHHFFLPFFQYLFLFSFTLCLIPYLHYKCDCTPLQCFTKGYIQSNQRLAQSVNAQHTLRYLYISILSI